MTPVSGRPGHMDGTPMTTFTRKGWQSHGSHAHVQTAMLVIAVVDLVGRVRVLVVVRPVELLPLGVGGSGLGERVVEAVLQGLLIGERPTVGDALPGDVLRAGGDVVGAVRVESGDGGPVGQERLELRPVGRFDAPVEDEIVGDGHVGVVRGDPLAAVPVGQVPAAAVPSDPVVAGLSVEDVSVERLVPAPVVSGDGAFVDGLVVVEAAQLVHAVLERGGSREEPVVVGGPFVDVVADAGTAFPIPLLGVHVPAGGQVVDFGAARARADHLHAADIRIVRVRIVPVRRVQARVPAVYRDGGARRRFRRLGGRDADGEHGQNGHEGDQRFRRSAHDNLFLHGPATGLGRLTDGTGISARRLCARKGKEACGCAGRRIHTGCGVACPSASATSDGRRACRSVPRMLFQRVPAAADEQYEQYGVDDDRLVGGAPVEHDPP